MHRIFFIFLTGISIIAASCGGNVNEYYNYARNNIKKYDPPRKDYAIIVDYRKNILSERLYVINMKTGGIQIKSRVSHAFNSGILYARKFSNEIGSNKSSSGNFLTSGTYYGKSGYSMIILGLDRGINNNAKSRFVVFHSTSKMITPWSLGCFAVPESLNRKIIDLTKEGCLVSVIRF